jgi:RNA polymerase sigma-70 factor, ECF subfamily
VNDSELLALLWTKAYPTVAAYVSSMVPDFHSAEDLLQQVAVVLVRKFPQYDRGRPFNGWVLGIARYEVLKHYRRRGADRRLFSKDLEDLMEPIAGAYEELAGDLDAQRWALNDCLKHVSGRSRAALEFRYVDDLKPAVLAQRLGLTSGAARALLHRVREILRDCIQGRIAKEAE